MFGYVKIYKPELKVKDYEAYKAVYCSLCRQLKKDYGIFAPLTLNYDFTLLALTRMAFSEECPGFKSGRCEYNPLKKCQKCINGTAELEFAAASAMLMCYYKVQDDIEDSSFFKGLAKRLLKPYFAVKRKKAMKKYAQADAVIAKAMAEQVKTEKAKTDSIDAAAHPSAYAMGELLKIGFEGETAEKLQRFGYLAGRWVYFADALDDMESDRKTNSYNVFNNIGKEEAKEKAKEKAVKVLNLTAGELARQLEEMKPKRFKDILENIVFDGTEASVNTILGKEKNKPTRRKRNEQESL